MTAPEPKPALAFHGGTFGALLPFVLFVSGVVWLGLTGAPDERGFWPILLAALATGLLLAKDRGAYAEIAIAGMSRKIVMLMILAWMLAGILATILNASGFVDGLVWVAAVAGVDRGLYCAAAFLICCAVSTATGTSLGTILVCSPLLYPAGGALDAEPVVLIGAILGGATFGDNISPVSDTTIASATSQDAEMGRVVKSRLRYALPAAAIALTGYLVAGFVLDGGATGVAAAAAESGEVGDPSGLPMLAAPALVIALLVRKRHLVEGLLFGVIAATVLALVLGRIAPAELFHVDKEQFGAQSLVIDGIARALGVSVFTLFLMALVAGLEASGLVRRWTEAAARRTTGPRSAELWLFGLATAVSLLITHPTVAILILAGFARSIGERFGIDRYRRANVLDVTVCTLPFLVPYCIPAILAASTTANAEAFGMPRVSPLSTGLWNLHSWLLLAVILFAIVTGWGRTGRGVSSDRTEPVH